jgi:hypothetical protein
MSTFEPILGYPVAGLIQSFITNGIELCYQSGMFDLIQFFYLGNEAKSRKSEI